MERELKVINRNPDTSKKKSSSDLDSLDERLSQILGTKDEVPGVDESTLQIFLRYLKENLEHPCVLTGSEDIGIFGWEERYRFINNKKEYAQRRKKEPSYKDTYKLMSFANDVEYGIWVKAKRESDKKTFDLPLKDLEVKDRQSKNFRPVQDYVIWYVNWR